MSHWIETEAGQEITDALGMCACGIADEVADWVIGLLRKIENRKEGNYFGTPEQQTISAERYHVIERHFAEICADRRAEYAIWYWLDSRGLLEHGGGIGGSWLTEKGRNLLTKAEELSRRINETLQP